MFQRFTDPAKHALFLARRNAWLDGSTSIEPFHLLHALTDDNDPVLREALAPLEMPAGRIRSLLPTIPRTTVDPGDREIPFSAAMKQALTFGVEEADALHHVKIGPGHLLLGLLRAEEVVARGPLTKSGVRIEAARIAVREAVKRERTST